jgi:acetamidase/formamidase
MYYKCQVKGGLFSIGDPHVSQGDGDFRHRNRKQPQLPVPDRAAQGFRIPLAALETPKNWIVHGFGDDLDMAMKNAAKDMLHLLTEHQGLSADDAYSLMSVAADFGVTQVVDGTLGVHVRVDRSIFPHKGTVRDPQ